MGNIVPSPLRRLRAADIIRMAGLATASLGQEYCRAGAVHSTKRQSTRISGLVDVQYTGNSKNGETLETRKHYHVAVDLKADETWGTQSRLKPVAIQVSCQCQQDGKGEEGSAEAEMSLTSSQTMTLCCHAAALLFQWLVCPAAFIVVPPVSAETDATISEQRTEVVEKDAAHSQQDTIATKLSSPSTGERTMGMRFGTIQRDQSSPLLLGDLLGILVQLGLSDLRGIAREYEIPINGMSKQQLAEAILEKLKQPEAVRSVAATLEKRQRQLLAALTLAGGLITDTDLRGLFQRFSLGQPSQLHGTLTALQAKGLLFHARLNNLPQNSKENEKKVSLDVDGWYIPQEVRAALRVSMPVTPFNEMADNQKKPASIQKLSKPYGLLADLLLVAHALDGYQLKADNDWSAPDVIMPVASPHSSNLHSTDGSAPLPPPIDMPSSMLLSSLQEVVERSPEFLRLAIRLLRLAGFLYKDQDDEGRSSLRMLPNVAQLLLGPSRVETLDHLFELWLSQSSYGELFELQDHGLRLRCRTNSRNVPILRSSELDAENSAARQAIIALLAQAPLNQWLSFSAFVRFVYRLNPYFLQRQSRLFPTPHWWIEQDNGRPLRPLQLNDWLQAESLYLERFLCGPLYWWGICDLVTTQAGNLLAFRLTPFGNQMVNEARPTEEVTVQDDNTQSEALKILDTNELLVACSAQTWQIIEILEAFAEKAGVRSDSLCYRLTPKSLGHALSCGHRPETLLNLLRNVEAKGSPSDKARSQLLTRVEQWMANYGRIRIYTGVSLLETTDPLVIREISLKTSLDHQIVKSINPTLFILKKGSIEQLTNDLKHHGQFPLLHNEEVYAPE
jgi:hypothetical protein